MGAVLNTRDKSRTTHGKTFNAVKAATRPPEDQGGWMAETRQFLESDAYRTLSINARRVIDRLKIEHISHGRVRNGHLIVTHEQFISYGVTCDLVADAIDECVFKGLVKTTRGRAGNGTAHPNIYTLTFDGTFDGRAASNEWRRFTADDAKRWSDERKRLAKRRANIGRKRKSSLGHVQVCSLGEVKIRNAG